MVTEMMHSAIKNSGMKKSAIAKGVGITHTSLNNKLYGRSDFTVYEAYRLMSVLNIPYKDFHLFFTLKRE